jgi:hypothetical protein
MTDVNKLTKVQLKQIVQELEINQPVMSYRVVGSRVELHLLGGATAVYDPTANEMPDPTGTLTRMTLKRLHILAAAVLLPNQSKMNKAQLIKTLSKHDRPTLYAAIESLEL